jgi:hypothetical protein
MRGIQIDDFRRRRLSRRRVCITYRVDFAYNLDDVLFIRQGRDGRQFTDITTYIPLQRQTKIASGLVKNTEIAKELSSLEE